MANFLNKLGDMAKNAADKTGEMLEITKLNAKISTEQAKIAGYKGKLGEYYYQQMCDAPDAPPEALELCGMVRASQEAIAALQLEVDALRGEKPAVGSPPSVPEGAKCPVCGTPNPPGTRFCGGCGGKLQ